VITLQATDTYQVLDPGSVLGDYLSEVVVRGGTAESHPFMEDSFTTTLAVSDPAGITQVGLTWKTFVFIHALRLAPPLPAASKAI